MLFKKRDSFWKAITVSLMALATTLGLGFTANLNANAKSKANVKPKTVEKVQVVKNYGKQSPKGVKKINKLASKQVKKPVKKAKYTGSKRYVLTHIEYQTIKGNTKSKIWKQYYAVLPINQRVEREYIAWHESNGRWDVMSASSQGRKLGHPVGRYQVSEGYFPGKYRSHPKRIYKNEDVQEKTANKYMKHRYGTWAKAAKFWSIHHWW